MIEEQVITNLEERFLMHYKFEHETESFNYSRIAHHICCEIADILGFIRKTSALEEMNRLHSKFDYIKFD